jgi:hypothetical protein
MINVMSRNIQLEGLREVELKRPDRAGAYWQGIPHYDLSTTIIEAVRNRGWEIGEMQFALSPDQADLAGAMELKVPGINIDGIGLGLGFITSNMMRTSLRLMVGGRVTICSNGLVTGEIILKTKHTSRLDLGLKVVPALDSYEKRARRIEERVTNWKSAHLKEDDVNGILMNAGRSKVIPWSRVGKVDAEFKTPSFDYKTEKDTAWDLLNAFTHIVKESPPLQQMGQINRFRQLLPYTAN